MTPVELWDAPKVAFPRGRWQEADRRIRTSSVASARGVVDRGIVCEFFFGFLEGNICFFFLLIFSSLLTFVSHYSPLFFRDSWCF